MGYLIVKIIEEVGRLANNLFPKQGYLESIEQIPSYLSQVGTIMIYICFAIILLIIIILGIYLGLRKLFTYWSMIE